MSGPRKLDNPARVKTKNYYLVWYETRYMGRQPIRQTMGKEFVNRNVRKVFSHDIILNANATGPRGGYVLEASR